jgi:hypothetical protein
MEWKGIFSLEIPLVNKLKESILNARQIFIFIYFFQRHNVMLCANKPFLSGFDSNLLHVSGTISVAAY